MLEKLDGKLTPVIWGGLTQSVNQYQGALDDKNRLQQAYSKKLDEHEAGTHLPEHDWSGMNLVLDKIASTFSKMQG